MKIASEDFCRYLKKWLRIAFLFAIAWFCMIYTHELGHISVGILTGGTLIDFDLIPWHLPYSLFSPDPFPLLTLWSGPLLGVGVPWLVAWKVKRDETRLVAHFCSLANGTYLAIAWFVFDSELDTTKLIKSGADPIWIVLYCAFTIGTGYPGFRNLCKKLFHISRCRRSES